MKRILWLVYLSAWVGLMLLSYALFFVPPLSMWVYGWAVKLDRSVSSSYR